MRVPPPIRHRDSLHQVNRDGIAYTFGDLKNSIPFTATPRDELTKLQTRGYFTEAPLLLSAGAWTAHSPIEITSSTSIHMIGSGFHTSIRCGARNSAGAMLLSGSGITIENMRFVRDSNSGVPDAGFLLLLRASSITIRNCWFDGRNALNAIHGTLSDKTTIESCIFSGGAGDIIYLRDSDDAMIKNNRFIPAGGWTNNAINLDSTNTAVAAERCNDCVVVGNHVGGPHRIRYNTSGAHAVASNNTAAVIVNY